MNILIQKKNALFNYKAFSSGFIRNGPYKGKSCEIIDILSTGLYQVRVALMDSVQQTNIDPTNIIPDKHEKYKIEKALYELKSPGFVDLLKKESQIIMLSNIKNKIRDVDHLYELFYPNQKPVYTKKTIIIQDKKREIKREILVAEPFKQQDTVINDFLQLIFDKVKIQLVIINDEINNELKKRNIKHEELEQEEYSEPTTILDENKNVDYVNIEMLENDIKEKPQEELFDFEENLKRKYQEPEYIIQPKDNLFFRASEICGLPINPEFINSHSQIIENYTRSYFKQSRSYNENHNYAIVTAYIFIYFNQMGKQILHEILDSLKIKITNNYDPESIINLMLYHSFLKKSDTTLVIDYISKILNIEKITLHKPGNFKQRLIKGSGADPRTYKNLPKPMLLNEFQIRKTIEEPIKYDIAEKIKFRLIQLNKGGTIDEIESLTDLQYYFSNPQEKKLKYNKYQQVYLSEYNKRLNNFENEYSKMMKKKSSLLKKISSPVKNEINKKFFINIKKEISEKIKNDKDKLYEYNVLQYFLNKFDKPELIYTLLENPKYAGVIKPYIVEYEKTLNETILKNKKASLEKIVKQQNLDSIENQQKLNILRETSNNIRSIINASYNPYYQGNTLKYNPDAKKIKLFEKLLANLSIISDYTPEKINEIKTSIEFYNKVNADIIEIVVRRNYLFDLLKIKQSEQGNREVPKYVIKKSGSLDDSNLDSGLPVSSLIKSKKYYNDGIIKEIQQIKDEFTQLDKYIHDYQTKQIRKIKDDIILKQIQELDDNKKKIYNEFKKNKNKKVFDQQLVEFNKFKKEKEKKTQIFLNELNSIVNKTNHELDYDNQVVNLYQELHNKFNSLDKIKSVVSTVKRRISHEKEINKKLIYSNEYYKSVNELNSKILNNIKNIKEFTNTEKKYFIDRLHLVFNGKLNILQNSFDKNKKNENNNLINLFNTYQQELNEIKKIDRQNQPKRSKANSTNLIKSFQKLMG